MRGAITERQRQDYLEAMGIQPWFPRFKLPNARPSQACEWVWEESDFPTPIEEAITSQQTYQQADSANYYAPQLHTPVTGSATGKFSTESRASQPRESSSILVDLGHDKNSDDSEKPEASADDSTTEVSVESTPAEPFRIAAIDINEHCLAVIDLPWSGLNQFTGYHDRLLRNILLALDIKASENQRSGMFAWPITPEAARADKRYAREALHGFLNNQFGLRRRKTILLFGRTSCHYLWDQDQDFDQCRGYQNRNGIHYALTCSLGEMMSLPDFKADAWQDLAPLREHLQST